MLKIALAFWLIGVGTDNATTYDFAVHYTPNIYQRQDGSWFRIQEGNPLFSGLQNHPAVMSATIAASDALTYWVVHRFVEPHNRKTAIALFFVLGGERLAIGMWNMHAMHGADQAISSQPATVLTSVHATHDITFYSRSW